MKISVCIPCYEMHGVGVQMLERSLEALEFQTFKAFEVVVADNSENDAIKNLCKENWELDLKYIRNSSAKGMAKNTNYALTAAKGELIKILYQDDYLAHEKALQVIVNNFKNEDSWLITACSNNLHPYYSEANTLGSPSVLTVRNQELLYFDENLKWVLDLDYYKKMYNRYGLPKIINDVNVVIGIGEHQETNHLTHEEKIFEETLINAER